MFNCISLLSSNSVVLTIDIVLCALLCIAIIAFLYVFSRRIVTVICCSVILIGGIVCLTFELYFTSIILLLIFAITLIIFSFVNISEFRSSFTKPQNKKGKDIYKYNKDRLYQIIDETVHSLSRSKTGAIMTFEKSTNLEDVIKSGTSLNAPVSQELLETIFYEGTRLHDGAVVIRGNVIIAASVYYTPTTRALTGKYGSRHRAAFGISEISDAVTVVVSEETGRVSIAYNGNLEAVSLDQFLREFSDLMNSNTIN